MISSRVQTKHPAVRMPARRGTQKPVTLWDLAFGECRWPIDAPNGSVALFCGEPVIAGCSWCQAHRSMVFAHGSDSRNRRPAG